MFPVVDTCGNRFLQRIDRTPQRLVTIFSKRRQFRKIWRPNKHSPTIFFKFNGITQHMDFSLHGLVCRTFLFTSTQMLRRRGTQVRVRGHSKVLYHPMFGILALTVDQLLRFVNRSRPRFRRRSRRWPEHRVYGPWRHGVTVVVPQRTPCHQPRRRPPVSGLVPPIGVGCPTDGEHAGADAA